MPVAKPTARLEARISTDLDSMLKHAAELQGLSLADQECLAQALRSPPKPAPALKRAFTRRSTLLRTD